MNWIFFLSKCNLSSIISTLSFGTSLSTIGVAEQPPAALINFLLTYKLPSISSATTVKWVYAFTLILVSMYGNKPTNSNVAQQGVGFSSII